MSERGALRIVVEGDDAHRFHEGLMGFITQSESNPETRIGTTFRSKSVSPCVTGMA